jgi:hypothetical protein
LEAEQKFRQVAGDLIEDMGSVKASQAALGSRFSAESFLTASEKLKDQKARAILGGKDPSVMRSVDDLATIAAGARHRGREINASRTQTHAAKAAMVDKFLNSPLKSAYKFGRSLTFGIPIDMALASEWLPEAVINGGKAEWKKALARASRGAIADVVTQSNRGQE